jgi:hypothetical protein
MLDLLIARVSSPDVDIEAHVIQCPDVERALTRPELPGTPDIIVSSEPVKARVPVLALQVAPRYVSTAVRAHSTPGMPKTSTAPRLA